MMEAFFFRDQQLFGCYHPATTCDATRLAVVCPPLFDEYRRSYRALGDLANAISEHGVHVLRFDYFGTGDSWGTLERASIARWIADIDAAIDEGLEISGASEAVLVGVRFGATLAAQSTHQAIRKRVFWDPIVFGSAYLAWVDEVNRQLEQSHRLSCRLVHARFERIPYEMFHLSSALRDAIAAIRINGVHTAGHSPTYAITTTRSLGDPDAFQACEFSGLEYDWPAYHNGLITHKPVLQAIVRRVMS